jgi:hypothetical protein
MYGQPHPLPATSPHQVSKLSAGYPAYGQPPVGQPVSYAFQTPPPAGSHPPGVGKLPMHGQIIYTGEYYTAPPQQSASTVSPVAAYRAPPIDLTGNGLGPQRGAMFAQPSPQSYHPYRRS